MVPDGAPGRAPLNLGEAGLRPPQSCHFHSVDDNPQHERRHDITLALSTCPICEGNMELVYNRNNQQVLVCADCHSGLTVPNTAWEIVRIKKQPKLLPKPDRRKS